MTINRDNVLADWTAGVRVQVAAINARFSDLTWGTYGSHHPTKDRATDGMVPSYKTAAGKARGWAVARALWADRKKYGIWYLIFDGKIISETNPSAGWQTYYPTAAAIAKSPDSAYHRNHVPSSFYALPAPVKTLPVYVVDPEKIETTLTANAPDGKEDQQRPPGFRITTGARIVEDGGHKWLITEAGYSYRMDFLVLESEFKKRPPKTPEPVVTVDREFQLGDRVLHGARAGHRDRRLHRRVTQVDRGAGRFRRHVIRVRRCADQASRQQRRRGGSSGDPSRDSGH